jgi:hypothetical protein
MCWPHFLLGFNIGAIVALVVLAYLIGKAYLRQL